MKYVFESGCVTQYAKPNEEIPRHLSPLGLKSTGPFLLY